MGDLLAWFNPTRWILLGLLVLALGLGYVAWADHQQEIGEQRATTRYNAAIAKQKDEARQLLAAEAAKTRAAERALRDFKDQRELEDGQNKVTVADLERRLRVAAGPGQRLRDPNAAGCGRGGGGPESAAAAGASDRAADAAEAGGLLSAQLTGLLQRLTREADDINLAYASCRADALSVRQALPAAP